MSMETIYTMMYWIWQNKVTLAILLIIYFNRKQLWKTLIFQPLTDGNGVVRTYEWTRFLIVLCWVWLVIEHEKVTTDKFLIVTTAVVVIAKLKDALDVLRYIYGHKYGTNIDEEKENNSEKHE